MSRFTGKTRYCSLVLCLVLSGPDAKATDPIPKVVEFNRDIRPILSDACFQCHGPDAAKRKADLRLDTEAGAFADLGGYRAFDPKHLEKSEAYRRITTRDGERMPPARFGRTLTEREIALIGRWIEQGAKWQKHWAFIPPLRPELPTVKAHAWVRNPIDHFILDRLEREGLSPSAEADRTTLIRRATLDLTGLPPTPAEVAAFVADRSPDAFEKVVDRLLASPRYGERMAVRWLDAARYADTNGYQSDGERFMWRWRDWVIDALNRNMPFDQFTIEQVAGDLLPNATLEQKIATGFNRNHRGNAEGGIIPEEYAVEYVADRVETTATVWLGLTMTCCRCHDHKYDPIRQKEFYQVFSFFNNVPERGRAIKYGNSAPILKAPTPDQQEQLRKLDQQLAAAAADFARLQPDAARAQAEWEKKPTAAPADWTIADHQVAHFSLDEEKKAKFQDGTAAFVPGRLGKAGQFDGRRFVDAGDVGDFGFYDKFTLSAWVNPTDQRGGILLSRMAATARSDGYSLVLENGKVQLNLVKRWLDDALRVETEQALVPGRWQHVLATYDGSRFADGVKIYLDGQPVRLKVNLDELNQSFRSKEPFRIGATGGTDNRFHGALDDVRVYDDYLSPEQAAIVATPETIAEIAALPAARRTPPQTLKLRTWFLENQAPAAVRAAQQKVRQFRRQRDDLFETFPTTMVMEEMKTPRDAHVLLRGEYDKRGEKVAPGVPAALSAFPAGAERNRLGFARWLVDPANPLTARVTINRHWQMFFGTGLVKTAEDFGAQGEWPSHPELLDFLATEFVRTGWDVKAMHRRIVTSAAYRQSSRVTPALLQKDPENRLLARGPRLRLSAEMVRDQALFVSGLLVEKAGGPSVKPYQPAGLWRELTSEGDYQQDQGTSLYRRSLYTFWKRTIPPPSMMTFDAAGRELCTVRESRTNTPLQALTLMNEVTYVEAARVLAERMMKQGGKTAAERIEFAFQLATGRHPKPLELEILTDGFRYYLADFQKDRPAALKLLTVGDAKRDEKLDPSELAAYTAVAGLVLNLDEVVTKE